MGLADDIINGTYGNKKKKKNSLADQIINGEYKQQGLLGLNKSTSTQKEETPTITLREGAGTSNKQGYIYTGRNYGDYWYQDYAKNKDTKIYEKDGKYYLYYESSNMYTPVEGVRFMTSEELSKKQLEEAKKLGYTGNSTKLNKIADQIKLDTAGLTAEERKEYTEDLLRQQEDAEEDFKRKNEVRYGGAGLKGALGELKHLGGNLVKNVDEGVVEPITTAKDSYDYGKKTEELGKEYYKMMNGEENRVEELEAEIQKYSMFNQDIVNSKNIINQSIQSLPNQIGGLIEGVKGGGAGGLIGAIGGAIIGGGTTKSAQGTLAGAQTGAKWLGGSGYVAGQTKYTYELEAGLQYKALLDMGVPEDIAKKEAKNVGVINALIESGESVLDIATLGRSSKLTNALKDEMVKKYGSNVVSSWGEKIAKSQIQNTFSEALEEGLQEKTAIESEKRATEEAGIIRDDSEDWNRIKESVTVAAFSSFFGMGAVNVGTNAVGTAINNKKINNVAKEQIAKIEKEQNITLTEAQKEKMQQEIVENIKHSLNSPNNLTKNEQTVVENEVETRLQELENNGTKITNQKRNEIFQEVADEMKKGYISTDTIESTLGGDTYNNLKSIRDKKSNLEKQIKELETKKNAEITVKEMEHLKALREELSSIDTNTLENQLRSEMSTKIANDGYLQRSYQEKAERSNLYTVKDTEKSDNADVTSWQQSFVDAKSNNTSKAHDFNEFGTKIIQDKNIKMRAVNYDTLVEEGKMKKVTDENGNVSYQMEVNGEYKEVAVNGFKENGVLNVNLQSNRAFETTVGHELGEFIKDSDANMYEELKQIAIELGKADGTYTEAALNKYADVYGENTDSVTDEYVNDKLGELFTNDKFVEELSVKPSLLKKILDEIKHLVKLATTGSNEKRKLLSLQHKLENKFKEAYKNTDLTKETNTDTKYSLSEAGTSGNLRAMTNITLQKLDALVEDGVIVSNSIGILKDNIDALNSYGEATMLFSKDTIDPENELNKVYASDVYSKRHPKVVEKIDYNQKKKLEDYLGENISFNIDTTLREEKNRHKENPAFIDKFAEENNIKIENIYKDKSTNYGFESNPILKEFIIENNIDFEKLYNNDSLRVKFYEIYRDGSAFKGLADRKIETWENIFNQGKINVDAERRFNNDFDAVKNGNEQIIDDYATTKAKKEKINNEYSKEYDNYLTEKLSPIFGKKQIIAKRDKYGNPVYKDYTPENVLNAMTGNVRGEENGMLSVGSIRSHITPQFNSIDEIKANEDKIISYEEMTEIAEKLEQKLSVLEEEASEFGLGFEDYRGALVDIADLKKITQNKAKKILNEYSRKEVSDKLVEKSINFLNELKDAPTGYFEAKPQRLVGFDEVKALVIPNTVPTNLRKKLENAGFELVEYDPAIEGDRQRVINQFDYLKFSLSDSNDIAPINPNLTYAEDVKLQVEEAIAPLKEEIAELKESIAPIKEVAQEFKPTTYDDLEAIQQQYNEAPLSNIAPEEVEQVTDYLPDTMSMDEKSLKMLTKNIKKELGLSKEQVTELESVIQEFSTSEIATKEDLFDAIKDRFSEKNIKYRNEEVAAVKSFLRNYPIYVSDYLKTEFKDGFNKVRQRNFNKLKFNNNGVAVDSAYQELNSMYPSYFPDDITNAQDQLQQIIEVANYDIIDTEKFVLPDDMVQETTDYIFDSIQDYKLDQIMKATNEYSKLPVTDDMIPPEVEEDIAPVVNASNTEVVEENVPIEDVSEDPIKKLEKKKNRELKKLGTKEDYISNKAYELYDEVKGLKKGVRATYDLSRILDVAFANIDERINGMTETQAKEFKNQIWRSVTTALLNVKAKPLTIVNESSNIEKVIRQNLNNQYDGKVNEIKNLKPDKKVTRKDLHQAKINYIKDKFHEQGFDFDEVLDNAKSKSTLASVDNTPQRFVEKSLGYKEGQILNDITSNQTALNESKGIKWLNSFTNRKDGTLAKISKEYNIKPFSKEDKAAQMYGEGFYVNDKNELVAYGDKELAADFPDVKVQENIKGLAKDSRIRQIYDETLNSINESRVRNGYPEIPRRNDYFLHFRAMEDTFSRMGLPFNPNDIKAKDLPTDLAGMTVDLKPGQPYFASAKERKGLKTTYSLLGGMEKYLNSAKNQIYHIDDIQTLRALRDYVAEKYGQAKGLENLDNMTDEEIEARIKEVYDSHLSNFAKFLNEQANTLAGKTSLIDRGLEGIIGRRGIQTLDTINSQVGKNMVGYSIASPFTNLISTVQAFAKSNKFDSIKAFAQMTSNKISSIFGKSDGFVENDPTMIRRQGIDNFYRTPYQKVSDTGYLLMGAIDNISSEFIIRTKYNELTRKGMSDVEAHIEAGKWASRIMGDRSLGQQPQLYNSKMLGLFTKFQLEVRNQLDSMIYDTVQDAKADTQTIQNQKMKNAKKAAKITSTMVQLAVFQHLFGKAFESVIGYNPAFDIVSVLMKAFGFDDEEDSEDTVLDNLSQGFLELLGDLPYTSTLTGGRIPIEAALPIEQFITGKDDYGNEKSRLETLSEALPYYILPGGYNQIKKTTQGLSMFDDDLPVSGSYTDSGNLRFPVEETPLNVLQAALFGQWANKNAGDYFDNERKPLKEKQIQEYKDLDIPIAEYWAYREGLSEQDTIQEKFDYINSLDVTDEQKNIMINNAVQRKEEIDISNYDNFGSYEEFDYATKNPEKYRVIEQIDTFDNYNSYVDDIKSIKEQFSTDNGYTTEQRKRVVKQYIESLSLDIPQKIMLEKMAGGYSIKDYENYMYGYIESLEMTAEEKQAIHNILFN